LNCIFLHKKIDKTTTSVVSLISSPDKTLAMCGIFGVFGEKAEETSSTKLFSSFEKLVGRGPDRTLTVKNAHSFIGFHRLAINGLDIDGDQPFHMVDGLKTFYLVCNGEIYNFRELIDTYSLPVSKSGSDCAIILPLYKALNYDIVKLCRLLHGEFSFAIILMQADELVSVSVATDPLSVRPVFIAATDNNESFAISSLLGGLTDLFEKVNRLDQKQIVEWKPGEKLLFQQYHLSVENFTEPTTENELYPEVVRLFEAAIRRRLIADRPIGCLLSGGLDSSLICSVAAKMLYEKDPDAKFTAFSIGMKEGTDIQFAKLVAEHVNKKYGNLIHQIIYFTPEEGLEAIDAVIRATETFDITTIRASVGQYLIGKYISQNSDVKVILNGDGADEGQMGYLYFYLHPDERSAQEDHYRLLNEIHLFDGLRVDRAISCHGLEARVPFLDKDVVDFFRSVSSSSKVPNKERMEKFFFRNAFSTVYQNDPVLPESILWRKKEAFSDGVSGKEKSWFQWIQEHINSKVTDEEFEKLRCTLHPTIAPQTKEAYYYMKKFKEYFGAQWHIIPHYWLPQWSGNTQEPSARVLKVYQS
jgi:asparagine synthase (glutamine-hydrolysing)